MRACVRKFVLIWAVSRQKSCRDRIGTLPGWGFAIELTAVGAGRGPVRPARTTGAPVQIPRRQMVNAMLFLARLAAQVRVCDEPAEPSMMMVDVTTVRGDPYGPTPHTAGGRGERTISTERTLLVDILRLPVSARADPAPQHDVRVGSELLRERLGGLPRLPAIAAGRAYRGLRALAERHALALGLGTPPKGQTGFTPIAPIYTIEHTSAQLDRWRRSSRCCCV